MKNTAQKSLINQAFVETLKERLPGYHWSQCIYYITIASCSSELGMEEYIVLACQTFGECLPYSKELCLSTCACICKIDADNQLHNCVYGTLSIEIVITLACGCF